MKDTVKLLFEYIRSVVCEGDMPKLKDIDASRLSVIYELSKLHDMAHIVGYALEGVNLPEECSEIKKAFSKQYMMAIYRYQRLFYEYKRICQTFEKNKIKYVPLKGSVIRPYYPKPWMRTSCDIDILIEESDIDRACEALVSELKYTSKGKTDYHDISLYAPGDVHLELHFSIKENWDRMDSVLETVWSHTYLHDGEYGFRQTDTFLLFHQVTHAAYHFKSGGCGLRPALDMWLLRRSLNVDEVLFEKLLSEAGLSDFAQSRFALSDVWYSGEEHSEITARMENYILGAGVYGNSENKIAASARADRSRFGYMMYRIFMPYRELKAYYPILKKHPILFPFCEVHRWFSILFSERRKHAIKELKHSANLTDEKRDEVQYLLKNLGLKQ